MIPWSVRRKPAILRFLVPYVAMLVFPILVALTIQRQAVSVVEQNVLSDNQLVLDQCRVIIDRYLEEMELTIQRLTMNKAIATFLSMSRVGPGDPRVTRLADAYDAISSYSVTNNFVIDLFLYARQSDTLLSTKTVHTRIDLDYKPLFRFGTIEANTWRSEMLSRTYRALSFLPQTVTLYGVPRPCIVAFQSIPLGSESAVGTAFVLIDQGKIRELLAPITVEGGTVRITDVSGMALLTAGGGSEETLRQEPANRRTGVVSASSSSTWGWTFTSVLPRSFLLAKVYRTQRIIWTGTAAFILAGIAVALFLAYRTSKPVSEIAAIARSLLGDQGRNDEDLTYIKDSMLRLVASNRRLEEARRRELPLTRATLLERILRGAIEKEDDLSALLRYNEIDLPGDSFVVFVVGIQGFGDILHQDILQELDLNKIVIRDALARHLPAGASIVELALDRMAILCSFDSRRSSVDLLERAMRDARQELQQSCRVGVAVTEGSVCTSLADAHRSFHEAWKTMEGLPPAEAAAGVMRFEDQRPAGFFYPADLESRLILLTRAGRAAEVARIMQELYERNIEGNRLPPPALQTFLASLGVTLARIAAEGEDSLSPEQAGRIAGSTESAEVRFALLRQALLDVCASVAARRKKTREKLVDQIVAFVRRSSTRPDLNLSMVAITFGLKESYLYHLFKEATGVTFASFLESLRMDEARTLLRGSVIAVEEVAARVGYSSAHSFRRAFKRCTALSPTEYQQAQGNAAAAAE